MHVEVKLTEQEEIDLLRTVTMLKRIGQTPNSPLASIANHAASKVNDVLQEVKSQSEEPVLLPF